AGAVLRPMGSTTTFDGGEPASSSWATTSATCARLHTTRGGADSPPATRRTVAWMRVSSPTREWNCLGRVADDSGHSRVPLPPDRMTGVAVAIDFTSSDGTGPATLGTS